MLPLDLLSHELIESLHANLTRRELLDSAISLGIVELLHGRVPLTTWHGGQQFSKEPPKTAAVQKGSYSAYTPRLLRCALISAW